jgi:hypothetical protein
MYMFLCLPWRLCALVVLSAIIHSIFKSRAATPALVAEGEAKA